MTQYRAQAQYINAANAVDPRLYQAIQPLGNQLPQSPNGFQSPMVGIQSSPVMAGMPSNLAQANVQSLAGIPQLPNLAQAAFVQSPTMCQPRLSLASMGAMAGLFGEQQPVTFCPGFEGSDVYIANQGVIVGRKEKRYVRIRWGDGQKGHKARWVGFAPSDWKMNRPLATDPQLLGFYVKPNLCDRSNKSKRNSGWVTLSIDCAHRAIKATIDGWTLGKVFIPTWLIGRVMRPVAVAETGMPVKFDLQTEEGCEKVLRAGFQKWSTIQNAPLTTMRCCYTGRNFESDVLGMSLDVSFDEEENVAGVRDCEDGYISYDAVDRGMAQSSREVIPLVINDRHAFRVKERGLWELFYADDRVPLDYLSERMTALIRKIYEAKHQRNGKLYKSAVTKLAHFRHILFFLAKDQSVVEDANSRVQWFLSNTENSGAHRTHTPDLGRLLTCVAVSDFEWEDIAVPFFAEALQRAIPQAMQQNPRVQWSGPNCCLEDLFDSLMTADKALSEMLLHVLILTKVMKPHHKQLDEIVIERLSAEELCCGIAGLSAELQILEYERSARKDEIKKCLIKREWQHEFSPEQWKLIEGVLDTPVRLRGMLNRSRMIAECHGSCGLPTPEMVAAIDEAHELGKTVEDFREYLECYSIEHPGKEAMFSIVKKAIHMAKRKGYLSAVPNMTVYLPSEGLLSARQALNLHENARSMFCRQGRSVPSYQPEVLPILDNQQSVTSSVVTPGQAGTGGEGEIDPATQPGHQEIPPALSQPGSYQQDGEPTPHAHTNTTTTTTTTPHYQYPILVNNPSDPQQPFLVHSTSPGMVPGGAPQYRIVQVLPNGQVPPSPSGFVHAPLLPSPATTPGSVRLVSSPQAAFTHFPMTQEAMARLGNQSQLLLSQTPRNPPVLQPNVTPGGQMYQEGERYTQTPTTGVSTPAHVAQHEGQSHYVLTYASPQNGVLIQV